LVWLGNTESKTPEPDWQQHDRPAACVIAQKYPFTTFVSHCYHSSKEKYDVHFK
jgi:hypothetical protein